MNRIDVPGTFREIWETRPSRPQDDRQLAGVASAVARRYDIDPTLVRIAFAVAAFTGIGAALYVAGWCALPSEPVDPAAPAGRRGRRPILFVALAVAAAGTLGSLLHRGGDGHWVLPLVAAAGLLFLLHRSRGNRIRSTAGRPTVAMAPPWSPAAGPVASAEPTVSLHKEGDATTEMPAGSGTTPPAWDPLGAAPFAWDLSEPGPAPSPPDTRRRHAPVTAVTLGLALLAGAGTAAVQLLGGQFSVTGLPVLLGVPVAVVGLGLVLGAFLHAGRGLVPVAVLGSVLTWGALAAPLDHFAGSVGDLDATPTSVAQVLPAYRTGGGDVTLDLSRLDLSVPAGGDDSPLPVDVSTGVGDVDVVLSPDADIRFTGDAGLGDVEFDGRTTDGRPGAHVTRTDLGSDHEASGRLIVLDVHSGAGDVTVRRG